MSRRRGWLRSLNVAATLLLLGALFILANYVSSRRYTRWDLTHQRLATPSEQTRQVLTGLTEPVSITVFYQPEHRLHGLTRDLLKEYARFAPSLKIEYVDPEQDLARARQLVEQLEIQDPNLLVIRAGERTKHLADPDLAEYDYETFTGTGEPRVKAFKGEQALTSALLAVTQAKTPRVWVTTGHGEKDMEAATPDGLTDFKKALEQQNVQVEVVPLIQHAQIPGDIRVVIVPGPARRFTESEVQLLERFLDAGGGLLALLDPLTDTGLEPLLERWGILVGNDIVVDPTRQLPFMSAANLFVTTYTQHPVVEKMKTLMTLFPLARSVRPVAPAPEGLAVSPLAMTSPEGWGESKTAESTFAFADGEDLNGPVSVAAAAQRTRPDGEPSGGRLVVVGDSEFVINAQLTNVGNRDFALAAVNWLAQQEQLIGITPKPLETVRLNLTGAELQRVLWIVFLALPALCALAGVGVWWRRRT